MRVISTLAAAAILAAPFTAPVTVLAEPATYAFNAGHTEVRFYWDHAGVSEQSGEWGKVSGSVTFDPEDASATKVEVIIDAASVDTGVTALDDHLKTADFFEVEKFPQITFNSTGVVKTGPETVRVVGDLTIKDTTKPVIMDVNLVHMGAHPVGQYLPQFYGGDWLGIEASGTLIRSEFGVGYGAPLTSDHIRLEISTEMQKQE